MSSNNVNITKKQNAKNIFKEFTRSYPTIPIILFMIIAFSFFSPHFFSARTAQTIMSKNTVVLIAAIGETCVLLIGGIDLSVSTVISVSAVLSASVMNPTGNIFLGVITAICVGLIFGLINGIMIGYFKMTPFITTMGTQLIAKGIAFVVSQGIAIPKTPKSLMMFGFHNLFGIPYIMYIGVALVIIFSILLLQTTWGRHILLVGNNKVTAEYTGINTKKVEMSAYVVSGLLAGIAGFISIISLGFAIPGVGDTLLLTIIGGVVIGGTSMTGGEGSVIRTFIGIALLAILSQGLDYLHVEFYDQLIILGILIFVGNSLATELTSKQSKAMK